MPLKFFCRKHRSSSDSDKNTKPLKPTLKKTHSDIFKNGYFASIQTTMNCSDTCKEFLENSSYKKKFFVDYDKVKMKSHYKSQQEAKAAFVKSLKGFDHEIRLEVNKRTFKTEYTFYCSVENFYKYIEQQIDKKPEEKEQTIVPPIASP